MTRILIADDEALVRGGLRMILEAHPDLEVVGEASNGQAALTQARELQPDLVLMDIRMPGLDGLGAPGGCSPDALAPKVVVLTTFDSDDYLYEATRAGASGFLLKSAHRSRATPYSPPRLPADCSTASSTVCLPSSRTPADLADLAELSPAERSASSGRCLSLNGQR